MGRLARKFLSLYRYGKPSTAISLRESTHQAYGCGKIRLSIKKIEKNK